MKRIVALGLLIALLACGQALAGVQAMVPCPALEDGCIITCAQFELLTSAFDPSTAPLMVEFLNDSGEILATATFDALGNNQRRANLDNRVPAIEVDSIRLYSEDDRYTNIGWASLQLLCDPCACACWSTVYKGCLCDWRPTPEPVVILEPLPEVVEVVEVPRLKRNEPVIEVIEVPGRG